MALYAAIGAEFKKAILSELDALVEDRLKRVITQTLKQVAHDYSLNYKELKTRYCAPEFAGSVIEPVPVPLLKLIVTVPAVVQELVVVNVKLAPTPAARP